MLGLFNPIVSHFEASHADGYTITTDGEIVLVLDPDASLHIQVDERMDMFFPAVFVNGHGIVGRVQQ